MCKKTRQRQSGLTLVELIVFIVIVSVGVAGILVTYDTVVRHSADPMARKQALAIAESLLLEIEQQPFTWCDPQDENVTTAASAAGCATSSQAALAPTPGESRGSNVTPFDNVVDYAGYTAPATDILGNASAALSGYNATVVITRAGGAAPFAGFPPDAVLRIAVTVIGGGETVTLVGYRTRYAPNAAG
ncbi:MAG: prepilin-type N-terminal cleavage/methylation domain-containing protein [Propionivibrio sp.]